MGPWIFFLIYILSNPFQRPVTPWVRGDMTGPKKPTQKTFHLSRYDWKTIAQYGLVFGICLLNSQGSRDPLPFPYHPCFRYIYLHFGLF